MIVLHLKLLFYLLSRDPNPSVLGNFFFLVDFPLLLILRNFYYLDVEL